MSAFEELGLMAELIRALDEMDWYLPKPVQQDAIPLILGGGDVMCAAETGAGKTGAFCLPILQVTWETLHDKMDPSKGKQSLTRCAISKEDCTPGGEGRGGAYRARPLPPGIFRVSENGLMCQVKETRGALSQLPRHPVVVAAVVAQ